MVTVKLQDRYQEEHTKRINVKGLGQYLDGSKGSLYALNVDPWVEDGEQVQQPIADGGHCKIVIFGGGFGGLCAAIRCLQKGVAASPDDILIVDPAGGFGGTWWWNRFPGLMCDIESYVYLPLLEETGYMPKRKYASGEEIREYADILAGKFNLQNRGMFQSSGKALTWNSDHWVCDLVEHAKGLPEKKVKITADFIILASGTFTYPKLPDVSGLDTYQGEMVHTARWRYDVTGGSAAKPELNKLANKKVAFIGTGATAVQAVPNVAKYAKELYVIQRTASSVDERNNRDTDPEEWKTKIARKKGWQFERAENFQAFTENVPEKPKEDLVNDGWCFMPTIAAAWGGPAPVKPEDVAKHVEQMEELDAVRSERVRQRAVDVVKDPETAKKLQAWYPGWCKRPCFHDEYLQAFNLPNTHLVDTEGRGLEAVTTKGIVADGKEYPVDLIIWGTGYGSPLTDSLAGKAQITVIGKNDVEMEKLFKQGDWKSLHGIIGHNFPNLFSLGLSQAGVGVNQNQRLDAMSVHVAQTISQAQSKAGTSKVIIEPTEAACDEWGDRIAANSYLLAPMSGCLPSYFNQEGDVGRLPAEALAKVARNTIWGKGFTEYARILEKWQADGNLDGLEVSGA